VLLANINPQTDIFTPFLHNGAQACIVLFFAYIIKKLADARTTRVADINDDMEIGVNKNWAIAIRRAGLYIGYGFGIAGALSGASEGFLTDIWKLAVDSALMVGILLVAREFNDRFMLHDIKNDEQAKAGNIAVGIVEFGSYLATGLILNGTFTGEGGTYGQAIGSTLAFAALGQIALLVVFWLYELITPFSVVKWVNKNNIAAAIPAAAFLVAFGNIARGAIAGPFVSWGVDLQGFAISFVIGVVLFAILRIVIDRRFVPKIKVKAAVEGDEAKGVTPNAPAMTVVAGLFIMISLVLGSTI